MAAVTPRTQLNRTGAFVAGCLLVMLGFAIGALVYVQVPLANQNALLVLLGALTTNVTNVVAFFFGQTMGNRAKDDTIQAATAVAATMADTAAVAQAALTPKASADVIPLAPGDSVTATAVPPPPTPPQDPT